MPRNSPATPPRALRSRIRRAQWRAVKDLIPPTGDVDKFVEAVARHRHRPITVLTCELSADAPSALWVQTQAVDYIVHAADITADHRDVVICHEIAHMLLGHQSPEGVLDTGLIAPTVDPSVAQRFFTRHGYVDQVETEAEVFGTLLAAELAQRASVDRAAAGIISDTVSMRMR